MSELKTTKIFLDSEFTGLHQKTTLISLALVDENGCSFYAEFTDYDESQIDHWLQEHVIDNLLFSENCLFKNDNSISMRGNREEILFELKNWLLTYDRIEIWSDCLSYDWVLFCDLFGHAFNVPNNVYYIPFDICTLFKIKNIDPDISREWFIENNSQDHKHNALYDASVIKRCYEKLIKL